MDLGCLDMGCIEKPLKENSAEKGNSPKETVTSASKLGKNSKTKDALRSSLSILNKLTSQISKPPHRKTSSPINWFPRKKVEPYLKRKIKMLQEVDGMHLTLDETLGDSNPHYSRVLREKIAIREAAEKAVDARKAAMVEASWCRILQAARIESKEAEAQLSKTEISAAEAIEAARAVGVTMSDVPDSTQNQFKIETGSTAHTISATLETAFEVDRQVAAAVKAAFIKLANCSSIDKHEFKELLRKVSENPDIDEICSYSDSSELTSECESDAGSETELKKYKKNQEMDKFNMANIVDMMLARLQHLKEEELASLATIVATSGLNAALSEMGNSKKPVGKSEDPCQKAFSKRMSVSGRNARKSSVVELPSLDKFLVKRLTRLEREVLEAKKARKNESSDDTSSRSSEVKGNDGDDLGSVLVKRSSKLEKEVNEARMNGQLSEMDSKKSQSGTHIKQDVAADVPSLDKYLVKRMSRLEREVQEARNRSRLEDAANSEGKENISTNLSHEENYESLDKVLVKHVSRLEREKLAFCGDEQMRVKLKRKDMSRELESNEGSLDQVLVQHKSRLEREKSAFCGEEQMRVKIKRKDTSRELESGEGSLDQVLVQHKSRLEREKSAFCGEEQMRVKIKRKDTSRELESGEGSLDQVLVKHKSRLEREKMASGENQQQEDNMRFSVTRKQARERELQAAWGGLSLGNSVRPYVSRLEREKAAWLKADEEERNSRTATEGV